MFDQLRDRLDNVLRRVRGQGRLTEQDVDQALRELRMVLLEADVALSVARRFVEQVRARAVGREVLQGINPGQAVVKILHDELVATMGEAATGLATGPVRPTVVLVAGLQGAGKTTTCAKLARLLGTRGRKRVLLCSTDLRRDAAVAQLQTLAGQAGAEFVPAAGSALDTAREALAHARAGRHDFLIVDSAGRLHVDEAMMAEVRALHELLQPTETLFVVDSAMGQDAVNAARAFAEALPLTGVILTKIDGDARGGAALSVRSVTGVPVRFVGSGERLDALEQFDPSRMASRILGMGDVVGLVEQAEQARAASAAQAPRPGRGFGLEEFRDQLEQLQRMGGVASLVDKLPGMGAMPAGAPVDGDRTLRRYAAIIGSMTPQERRHPDIIRASRKRRIAAGSGTQVQDVNRMLKQFDAMQRMMRQVKRGGLSQLTRALRGRLPGMPG